MAQGLLAAAFLAAAAIHFAICLFVLFAQPRRVAIWLVGVLLALLGGSALARGLLVGSLDASGNPGSGGYLAHVSTDLEWGASFLVLGIALLYPREAFPTPRARTLLAAGGALAFALTVWVIFDKDRFYDIQDRAPLDTWTSIWIDDARYYLAMGLAIALFGVAFLRRPTDSPDRSAEHLLIAFSLAPLFGVVRTFTRAASQITASDRVDVGLARDVISVAGTIAIASACVIIVVLARRRGFATRSIVAWGVGAVVVGGIVESFQLLPARFVSTAYGELAYLVVRPCIIGYAILRHQLLDIDVRVKRGFAGMMLAVAIAAMFVPTEEVVRRLSGLPPDLALPVGIGAGFAVVLVLHERAQVAVRGTSDRLFSRVREDEPSYMASRRREVYRSVLERSLDARGLAANDEDLTHLRDSLGVTTAEHEAVMAELRAAGLLHDESDDPLPQGSTLAKRYRVLGTLGQGASGVTYRCEDTVLHREVAVKEIDLRGSGGRARRRATAEARRLAAIRHDHVVTLLDVQEAQGRSLLIMELMQGGSLAARLAKGSLETGDARRIAMELLLGLAALHERGIVHRDVKPSNVLLDASGRVKVADLGVASGAELETMTGLSPAGTPLYMAPEQVLGLPVDERTDVYAAAAVLYEMLAGESYVKAATRSGTLVQEAIVSLPPPLPIAGAPAWANAFLARGLAKDPTARWPTARDALDALRTGPDREAESAPL